MKFLHTENQMVCAEILGARIGGELGAGKRVLWLIPGGSNIPLAVHTMEIVCAESAEENLAHLTITLTDERYGDLGHSDSNWLQLADCGFRFDCINTVPVLRSKSAEETCTAWGDDLKKLFGSVDCVIGQFGIGPDGHIAGVLPHSIGTQSLAPTVVYSAGKFTRISLTLSQIQKISVAYAFVFGAGKRAVLEKLQEGESSLDDLPAQVLQLVNEAFIYQDQITP